MINLKEINIYDAIEEHNKSINEEDYENYKNSDEYIYGYDYNYHNENDDIEDYDIIYGDNNYDR